MIYYYHYDALGSVVALSNNSGVVAESYSYDVFGQPGGTGSVGNPYFFTGRRYDDETALYYYRARYYNPDIGRFLQTDPIGYSGGLNLYTYCGNNPLNWIDPYGLKDYTYEETQRILRRGRTRGLFGPYNLMGWHEGLHFISPWAGGYDYKGWNDALRDFFGIDKRDTYMVGEQGTKCSKLGDSEFGNYIAGYLTQWHRHTTRHVHWAGNIEALGKDDPESVRDINRGARDAEAYREEYRRRPWWHRLLFGPI